MWHKFQQNHPVLYEVVQWGITGMSMAAIIISAIAMILRIL